MMDRTHALDLLHRHIPNANLVKHCIATEAIMRALAPRFGAEPDLWGLAGLLHDLDYERTKGEPGRHGLETARILEGEEIPKEAVEAIREHNAEALGIPRASAFGTVLTAAETVTGLVVAAALVLPDRKIGSVKPETVKNRMKERSFARSVNRDHIRLCEGAGIPLEEFLDVSLAAMASVAAELGL